MQLAQELEPSRVQLSLGQPSPELPSLVPLCRAHYRFGHLPELVLPLGSYVEMPRGCVHADTQMDHIL